MCARKTPLKNLLDLTGKLPWEERRKKVGGELTEVMSALYTSMCSANTGAWAARDARCPPGWEMTKARLCPQSLGDEMSGSDRELKDVGR